MSTSVQRIDEIGPFKVTQHRWGIKKPEAYAVRVEVGGSLIFVYAKPSGRVVQVTVYDRHPDKPNHHLEVTDWDGL